MVSAEPGHSVKPLGENIREAACPQVETSRLRCVELLGSAVQAPAPGNASTGVVQGEPRSGEVFWDRFEHSRPQSFPNLLTWVRGVSRKRSAAPICRRRHCVARAFSSWWRRGAPHPKGQDAHWQTAGARCAVGVCADDARAVGTRRRGTVPRAERVLLHGIPVAFARLPPWRAGDLSRSALGFSRTWPFGPPTGGRTFGKQFAPNLNFSTSLRRGGPVR